MHPSVGWNHLAKWLRGADDESNDEFLIRSVDLHSYLALIVSALRDTVTGAFEAAVASACCHGGGKGRERDIHTYRHMHADR